ncbi:hypothetical protein HYQ44_011651 [Verticillium longisporum]|nr:hypothetical protein HYQ44_011651 [Verticillium longisporum]
MDMRLTSGILKLSDFGLSETHRNPSRSRNMSNTNPGPYRAPEYDGNDLKVSIESDIWSLDCVFCELVTWAIRGHVGVSTFAKKRKKENARKSASKAWNEDNRFKKSPITNARRSKNPLSLSMSLVWAEDINPMPQPEEESKVKNSVLKWLRKLITEGRIGDGESLIVDFLDYIRDRMLDPDREARHTSHDVNKFLSRCLEKGNGDTNDPYWAWQPVME